uniref:SCP domain-containing protein n=1 Tax=Strongyloides stercoralis TaxID=6248 RepID=A0A0K0EMA8_STRER
MYKHYHIIFLILIISLTLNYSIQYPGIERRYYDSLIENFARNMNHFTLSISRRPQDDLIQAGVAYGIRWG